MSYTLTFTFGAAPGQAIHAQLLDTNFATSGGAITSGVTEVGNNGNYGYTATIADTFDGYIKFYASGDTSDVLALFAISRAEFWPWGLVLEGDAPVNAQTAVELMRLFAASMLAKTAPSGGSGKVARDLGDTKDRITVTVNDGYRTAVTLDGS